MAFSQLPFHPMSFTEFLRNVRSHVILDSGGEGDLVIFTFSLVGIARDG